MAGDTRMSLRRYDPDQVLRVEAHGLLSARNTGSPFNCRKEYTAVVTACQDNNVLFDLFTAEVDETISDAALGQYVPGIGRILFKFLAEIVNIQPDIMRLIPVLVPPDFGKQLIM